MQSLSFAALWAALVLAADAGAAGGGAPARCADPWIDQAVAQTAGRAPRGAGDHGECDLRLYGARWASYAQLREQVGAALDALDAAGLEFTADGRGLIDRRTGAPAALSYLGPAEGAPAGAEGIALPRGYLLVAVRPASAARERPAHGTAHPFTTTR